MSANNCFYAVCTEVLAQAYSYIMKTKAVCVLYIYNKLQFGNNFKKMEMHRGETETSMPLFCCLFQSGYPLPLRHCTLQHVQRQCCYSKLLTKEFSSRTDLSRRGWEQPKKSSCQMQVDEALALISFTNIIQSLMNQYDFLCYFKALRKRLFSYRRGRTLVT